MATLTLCAQKALEHAARAQFPRTSPFDSSDQRICLHFHPDRISPLSGDSVLASLFRTGQYYSQFATSLSNGLLDSSSGGRRWTWESVLFKSAYNDADPVDKPLYGALMRSGTGCYGPARRFGSAYIRLKPDVFQRTTIGYPDSARGEPRVFGKADDSGCVQAAIEELRVETTNGLDLLDRYVEAHIHGGVRLPEDAEAIVLDPSMQDEFKSLIIEMRVEGWPIEFHQGYSLSLEDFGPLCKSYKTDETVALGCLLAGDEQILTPNVISMRRALSVVGDKLDMQELKYVWHCLARYGGQRLPCCTAAHRSSKQ